MSIQRPAWSGAFEPGTLATIAGFGTTSPNGTAKPATMLFAPPLAAPVA